MPRRASTATRAHERARRVRRDRRLERRQHAALTYAAPTAWIYETLVNPTNPLPIGTCGDGVDDDNDDITDDGCPGRPFTVRGPRTQPWAADRLLPRPPGRTRDRAGSIDEDSPHGLRHLDWDCYEVTRSSGPHGARRQPPVAIQVCVGASSAPVSPVDVVDDAVVNSIGSAYIGAWIDDIEVGLQHWPEFGKALSLTLFDAGTFRDAQNFRCDRDVEEAETELLDTDRVKCEDGVGIARSPATRSAA